MPTFNKFSSMMFSSLFAIVLLKMLLLQTADAQVDVSVSPVQIDAGLSPSLDVNCTFSMRSSGMAAIISLTVTRENDTELASITSFSDHQVNVISNEGFTANGFINPLGQSYINLHWNRPTDAQKGTYQCIARGIDIIGHNIETVNTSVVSVNQQDLDFQDLLNELNQIKQEMQQMQTYIHQLEMKTENQFDLSSVFHLPPLRYNNKRYYVSKAEFQDFTESIIICKAFGGILAEMDDLDEYHRVQNYLKDVSHANVVFIGGTDEGHVGTWVLPSSGESLPVEDWYLPSEASSVAATDNCLCLNSAQDWRMYSCYCHFDKIINGNTRKYMCEV